MPDTPDAPDARELPSSDADFAHVWRLPAADTARGMRALGWCTGPGGELAVLLVEDRYLQHHASMAGWIGHLAPAPFPGELVTVTGDGTRRTPFAHGPAHGTGRLALLPDGRFVVSAGRTRRTGPVGPWSPTGRLFSPTGVHEGDLCLGDDIATLIADRHGRLWTSHGDEGIFGGHPESGTGFAAWDSSGRSLWTAARGKPVGALQGLAAATEGDDVWLLWEAASRSHGTLLTRIDPATGRTANCPSPVERPDGLAVLGDRAVFSRRDHNKPDVTLTRARRDGDTWTVTGRQRLRLPGNVVLHCGQGRDGTLWLRAGDTWSRVHV
jgi:hypothetical protein